MLRRIAYVLYPILIGLLIPLLLYLALQRDSQVIAGVIRKAELSTERPLVVRLAMGRSTAISFTVCPEKVVPGNPQGVEINFVGRDLTLRPLGQKPGNLIVYTKSTRYVILLQVGSEAAYDDAVVVNAVSARSRPIRLQEDSFTVEDVLLRNPKSGEEASITALIRREGHAIESDSFPPGLRCKGCVLRREKTRAQIVCSREIKVLDCSFDGRAIKLVRPEAGS